MSGKGFLSLCKETLSSYNTPVRPQSDHQPIAMLHAPYVYAALLGCSNPKDPRHFDNLASIDQLVFFFYLDKVRNSYVDNNRLDMNL